MSECITNESFQTMFLHMLWILRISQRLVYVISIYPDAIETGWCYTVTPAWRSFAALREARPKQAIYIQSFEGKSTFEGQINAKRNCQYR
jgi:hypothetical protein